jgi:hypothetical protein
MVTQGDSAGASLRPDATSESRENFLDIPDPHFGISPYKRQSDPGVPPSGRRRGI